MPNQQGRAVEMTGRGKRGKPNTGFPLFPPPLEIAARFPHSHRLDDESLVRPSNHRHRIVERSPCLVPVISAPFRLIVRLEYADVGWRVRDECPVNGVTMVRRQSTSVPDSNAAARLSREALGNGDCP